MRVKTSEMFGVRFPGGDPLRCVTRIHLDIGETPNPLNLIVAARRTFQMVPKKLSIGQAAMQALGLMQAIYIVADNRFGGWGSEPDLLICALTRLKRSAEKVARLSRSKATSEDIHALIMGINDNLGALCGSASTAGPAE